MLHRGAPFFLVAVLAVGGATPIARAHEVPVDVTTIVEEVVPATAGLTVQVVASVTTQLVLENATGEVVEVLDDEGRAFLRLDGERVEANLDVAAWYLSNDPFGVADVPESALDDRTTDDWHEVSVGTSWGWFDHRLHDGAAEPGDGAAGEVLDTWVVPLRVGSQPVEVRGVVVFQPSEGTYEAVISEQADGLAGQVVNGPAPALSAVVTAGGRWVVLGVGGEPLLRFSEDRVDANLASPTWHDVARAMSSIPVPAEVARRDEVPVWSEVASGPRFTWIDPRLALPVAAPDDPSFATSVSSWSVPVQAEGAAADDVSSLGGEIRWVPTSSRRLVGEASGGGPWGVFLVVVGLMAIAGGGAGVFVRRRRG